MNLDFFICLWQIRCTGRDAVPDDESVKKFCDKVASFCSVDSVHRTVHEHYFYSFFCLMSTTWLPSIVFLLVFLAMLVQFLTSYLRFYDLYLLDIHFRFWIFAPKEQTQRNIYLYIAHMGIIVQVIWLFTFLCARNLFLLLRWVK